MKNKICIIAVYFGKFPPYFDLWLKSCLKNTDIDFIVFTDNEYAGRIVENIKFVKLTLGDMKRLAEEKLEMKISLERPYKCCDFKPAYGCIFSDYLSGYEYWGHCDIDLLFGDILSVLQKYQYDKYDKFLSLGHLGLYRNTERCNNYFRLDGGAVDYREAFQTPQSVYFDEHGGVDKIYRKHGIPYFDKRIYADISRLFRRFRCAKGDKNYDHQVFYWEDGRVFRAYLENDTINKEEFLYIHFSMRKFGKENFDAEQAEAFFVGPEGFALKTKGLPTKEEILKYNKFPGKTWETLEKKKSLLLFKFKHLKKKMEIRKQV